MDGRLDTVECGRVVLCGGAYGSSVILERSGIGDPAVLARADVEPLHELAGVGENLHDHPAVTVRFAGGPDAAATMQEFGKTRWLPEEQAIAKIRSQFCEEGFDLHMYPSAAPTATAGSGSCRWRA